MGGDYHVFFQDSSDSNYRKQWWYLILSLFWNTQFILAFEQMVLAGTIATWYFTRDKSTLRLTVLRSTYRTLRYHIGSLAFGSLIIAIIQFIRAILYYIKEKTEDRTGPIVTCILRCCMCCFWCLEKFLSFINKNAYIEIAISGYSFCGAAARAFRVLGANLLRVVTLNTVTSVIIFVCKLVIVCATGIFTYLYIQQDGNMENELNYWGAVVFASCVIAFFIADEFLTVYDMAIDTIFLCWAEDCDRNKPGSYFMSDNLMRFMGSNNAKNPNEERSVDKVEMMDK